MDMVVLVLLAGATMLTHGWSLGDGLFLDDHWHQVQLRDRGWSWTDLLETTTLDPDEFMETWWQEQPIRWRGKPRCVKKPIVTEKRLGV